MSRCEDSSAPEANANEGMSLGGPILDPQDEVPRTVHNRLHHLLHILSACSATASVLLDCCIADLEQ